MRNPIAEQLILIRIKNKDKDAYGKFYDLYVKRIYRFIFFKVNSEHDAQDLTSEVFLKVWQYIKDDKDIQNLNSFIYMVARNCVIDFYRQQVRKQDNETPADDSAYGNADEAADPQRKLAAASDLKEILAGLKNLKDEYREVIILRFIDELSIREITEILKKPNLSVRVLLHRAMEALKKEVVK